MFVRDLILKGGIKMKSFLLTPWFLNDIIIIDLNSIQDSLDAIDKQVREISLEGK